MLNKITFYGIRFLYFFFHTILFAFFFYHSAFFIGEVDIIGELSYLEAILIQLATLIYIFVDYFAIKYFISRSTRKITVRLFMIIDSLLFLYFIALSILFIVFSVSVSLEGDTFAQALPFIAISTLIDIVVGGLFIGTRMCLVKRQTAKIVDSSVSSTETTE